MVPIIRFCLLFVLFFIVFLLFIRKYKKRRFGKWVDLGFNLIIIVAIVKISSFPFENLIFKYQSPTQAFSYLGRGDCLGIEESADSCILITNKGSEESYIYLEKEKDYFVAPFFKPKEEVIFGDRENGTNFTLIKEKGTSNYYIIVFTTKAILDNKECISITDNKNSRFQRLLYSDNIRNKSFYLYSTYVENMDNNYCIYINENEYNFN